MLRTIAPLEMKRVENDVMQHTSITGERLMQRAAAYVAAAVHRSCEGRPGMVLCICGAGNNGGDGLAAMRMLAEADGQFAGECWMLPGELSADAQREMKRLMEFAANQVRVRWLEKEGLPASMPVPACAVDAMFGTGLTRPLQGAALVVCRLLNQWRESGMPVVAVDIPSGLHGLTGDVLGEAVCASETVTFHRPKPGLYLKQGPNHAGVITVGDIGLNEPAAAQWDNAEGMAVLERADLARLLPVRKRVSHKGSYGKVLLWAGSRGMAGAAAISALAALRSGAGLVTVACPEAVLDVVQTLCPCATCVPLPQDADEAWRLLQQKLEWADALGAGCGLGQSAHTEQLLERLLHWLCDHPLPAVLDADALNLLAKKTGRRFGAALTLTPHPAEAARLLHEDTKTVVEDAPAAARRLAAEYGASVVLKGACSVLCTQDRQALNPFGTPAMAKGGSGDALTGVLAALLAGRAAGAYAMDDLEILQCACALHGLAGEMACQRYGERGMLATDLCECLGSIACEKSEHSMQDAASMIGRCKALGRVVHITVEHPAGMREPGTNRVYPRNCGYVQEVLEEENEWQDACICGVEQALEWFEGEVLACVQTDRGSVWAIVPRGDRLSEACIRLEMGFWGNIQKVDMI